MGTEGKAENGMKDRGGTEREGKLVREQRQ